MLKQYTRGALEEAVKRAQNSARLRTNLNIHESAESSVQRLFLAFEPDTYIRPHRHPQAHKWELFIILEGEIDLLIFNDAGDVVDRIEMSANATPASSTRVVEIPPGIWHSYICKQTGSLAVRGDHLHYQGDMFLNLSVIAAFLVAVTLHTLWNLDNSAQTTTSGQLTMVILGNIAIAAVSLTLVIRRYVEARKAAAALPRPSANPHEKPAAG